MTEVPDLDALIARAREAKRLEREAWPRPGSGWSDAVQRWERASVDSDAATGAAVREVRRRIEGA